MSRPQITTPSVHLDGLTSPASYLDSYGDFLTVEEVRAVLRIGKNRAYDLIRKKQLYVLPFGRPYRVPKISLAKFLAEQPLPVPTF